MTDIDINIGAPNHWCYKGEGACNIVLSYVGTDITNRAEYFNSLNYINVGKVLRLRKFGVGGDDDSDLKNNSFLLNVMLPLIGSKYVYPGVLFVYLLISWFNNKLLQTVIQLNRDFLSQLDEQIYNDRPTHRRNNRLNIECKRGLLILDLTLLTTGGVGGTSISVEIKPKCGFVTQSKYQSSSTKPIKSHTCRYCMHQYLKLKDGSIHSISKYCPLDLFSGAVDRQKRAIRALLECPQNNLKIYKDGSLFYTGSLGGKSVHSLESLCTLLDTPEETSQSVESTIDRLTNYLVSILQTEHAVLDNLLTAQRYDDLDIEAIYYLYQLQLQRQLDRLIIQQNSSSSITTTTTEKEEVQKQIELLDNQLKQLQLQPNYKDLERFSDLNAMTDQEIEHCIDRYLIATTAKDCSIMITFSPKSSSPSSSTTTSSIKHDYRVGVVDLDAKKKSSIPSYFKNDKLIIDTYKNNNENQQQSGGVHVIAPRTIYLFEFNKLLINLLCIRFSNI
ncbi:hypothetical protein PPL_05678 [Heterostelium album PN500]|uniref:Inositol-pentakisphosphate 2-kinase n=1 Tax=Heterostelium pallidum (strain ATCC 26659 / Pp 5 / PN500) TaxID=670386 RepID=D3BAU7_HETP5|nr:hypothetical protein PPL_05678 [Heterostelium album PN500]EFA81684.1 hypothetical protein PPL_05678 [Heterostelium album PN500]|eukprot:XP_020433801.1 hypothetical protein PPL_05678 [Heterostelium album PN500]